MSCSVHTFRVQKTDKNPTSVAFHEPISEGVDIYLLAQFSAENSEFESLAEHWFGLIVDTVNGNSGEIADRFDEGLKLVNEDYAQKGIDPSAVSLVVACFDFHILYLAQAGEAESYLVRGSQITTVAHDHQPDPKRLFDNVLQGEVKVHDLVLLGSRRLLRFLSSSECSNLLGGKDFSAAVESFQERLSDRADEDVIVSVLGIGQPAENSKPKLFASHTVEKDLMPKDAAQNPEEEVTSATDQKAEKIDISAIFRGKMGSIGSFLLSHFRRPARQWRFLAMGVIMGLLLVLVLRSISNYESQTSRELKARLEVAQQALTAADAFLLQGERGEANNHLKTAEESVQYVLNSGNSQFRSNGQFLMADIEEKKLQIENARYAVPNLVADLAIKNEGLQAQGVLNLGANTFVYDLNNIYKTVRTVVEKGIPIAETENILAAAVRAGQETLVLVTDGPRLIEYRQGVVSTLKTQDEVWKSAIDLKTFGDRFVYFLDPVSNQIWKYQRGRSSYGSAEPYNQGADLSRAVSLAIDGGIYVLSEDGSLAYLYGGERRDYDFSNLPTVPFAGRDLKVYTTAEHDYLYVLDPDQARILIFDKGTRYAVYRKQILYDDGTIERVRDFSVDAGGQRATLLTDDRIYELSL